MFTRAVALLAAVLALYLSPIHSRVFAADENAEGSWSGFYMSLPPDADENPFRVDVSRSGGGYRATVSSEEEGWRTEAERAGFADGLFTVSFPLSLPQAFGDHPPATILLRGVMRNGVWSGVFTMYVAERTLETGFTLRRESGGGRVAQRSGDFDIWGTEGDGGETTIPHQPIGGGSANDPVLAGTRPVWLLDPVLGMPFVMIEVPNGWMVEGRVQWNFLNRTNPAPMTLLFSHPASGRSLGLANNLGAFTWSEGKARFLRDGTFTTDTGVFNLRYRNAEAVLSEFLVPAIKRAIPGANALSLRAVSAGVENPSATGAGKRADIFRRAGRQVTGFEITEAELAMEYAGSGGIVMRDVIGTTVSAMTHPALQGTIDWDWDSLAIVSTPKGQLISEAEAAALVAKMHPNPAWNAARDRKLEELARQGIEASMAAQRQASAFMKQRMERYSMEAERFRRVRIEGKDLYVDPRSGEEFSVPFSKYAVRDTINDRIIYSDKELNPNLMGTGVVPLVRGD